jgi:7-carboxy-7-deazaguanine synthase
MILRVYEIFESIQGESTRAGQRCAFVRLAGCDVGCSYCDTIEAQDPTAGRDMTIDAIVDQVNTFGLPLVEITGGEPLMQPRGTVALATRLIESGKTVMLETSGCVAIPSALDGRVEIIMDVKAPSSGAADRLCKENLDAIGASDEVKFVLANRGDYEWARKFVDTTPQLSGMRAIHFSPAWGLLSPATLAAWMLEDDGPARLTVQLHKLLGVP